MKEKRKTIFMKRRMMVISMKMMKIMILCTDGRHVRGVEQNTRMMWNFVLNAAWNFATTPVPDVDMSDDVKTSPNFGWYFYWKDHIGEDD